MNENWQVRSELMLGRAGVERLRNANVLVVGLGGVGGYAAELICRAGVGKMTIADGDTVAHSNRNRQLAALGSTVGKMKSEVIAQRLLDINPELQLRAINQFIRDEKTDILLQEPFDYVVDAIDALSPKVFLLAACCKNSIPVVSAMGAGGKLDPTLIQCCDISRSFNCKLAKAVRKRLHRLGIRQGIKVVFSPEEVERDKIMLVPQADGCNGSITGTVSYMPAMFGAHCAATVIRILLAKSC